MNSLFTYATLALTFPMSQMILVLESNFLSFSSAAALTFEIAAFTSEGVEFDTKGVLLVS